MSPRQRRLLSGLAQSLDCSISLGRAGATAELASRLAELLEEHEARKLRFGELKDSRRELAEDLAERTGTKPSASSASWLSSGSGPAIPRGERSTSGTEKGEFMGAQGETDRVYPGAKAAGRAFERLYTIVARLRDGDGCPWDREQTPASLRASVVEEAYELVEAIDEADPAHVAEEAGDLLLLVTMIPYMLEQRGSLSVADAADGICDKLVRRHPHVFGEAVAETSDAVLRQWDEIKVRVEGRRRKDSLLDSVSKALPPLERAYKLQKKAAKAGFDWTRAGDVWAKAREEPPKPSKPARLSPPKAARPRGSRAPARAPSWRPSSETAVQRGQCGALPRSRSCAGPARGQREVLAALPARRAAHGRVGPGTLRRGHGRDGRVLERGKGPGAGPEKLRGGQALSNQGRFRRKFL